MTTAPTTLQTEAGKVPETASNRSGNIPSLDGLRAIAVTLVFVAHAGLDHIIPGGFGVTLFFFLSGYLITTLMRIEHEKSGAVNIKKFYIRRFLRIVPPLYITTTIAVCLALFHVLPSRMSWDGVLSHYFFFTNYFGQWSSAEGAPGCGPQWSLAVEEHFYLLFPLVFSRFLVKFPAKKKAMILFGFCAVVLIHRSLIAYFVGNFEWTYGSTDTRLDSIVFGCILALYRNPVLDEEVRQKPPSMAWFWVGLAALLACFVIRGELFRESIRYTIQGLALMPIFTIAILRYKDWPFTWLNTPLAKWIAAFSYTIYLVHFIGFMLVEHYITKDPLLRAVLAGVLIAAYAWALYAFVEKPIARIRKRYA